MPGWDAAGMCIKVSAPGAGVGLRFAPGVMYLQLQADAEHNVRCWQLGDPGHQSPLQTAEPLQTAV